MGIGDPGSEDLSRDKIETSKCGEHAGAIYAVSVGAVRARSVRLDGQSNGRRINKIVERSRTMVIYELK